MKTLIFIGGPTACGKSTLADSLQERINNSVKYRRYQGFFDIAKRKNLKEDEIFGSVSSEEVDDWFINICKQSEIVISDVHYAIQMNRDSVNIDIYQPYVPTLSNDLINKMLAEGIKIIVIFLSCSPEECLTRSIARYSKTKKNIRNISIEDSIIEYLAEEKEWKNIADRDSILGLTLDSETLSVDDLTEQIISIIEKNQLKKTRTK